MKEAAKELKFSNVVVFIQLIKGAKIVPLPCRICDVKDEYITLQVEMDSGKYKYSEIYVRPEKILMIVRNGDSFNIIEELETKFLQE